MQRKILRVEAFGPVNQTKGLRLGARRSGATCHSSTTRAGTRVADKQAMARGQRGKHRGQPGLLARGLSRAMDAGSRGNRQQWSGACAWRARGWARGGMAWADSVLACTGRHRCGSGADPCPRRQGDLRSSGHARGCWRRGQAHRRARRVRSARSLPCATTGGTTREQSTWCAREESRVALTEIGYRAPVAVVDGKPPRVSATPKMRAAT